MDEYATKFGSVTKDGNKTLKLVKPRTVVESMVRCFSYGLAAGVSGAAGFGIIMTTVDALR